MESYSPPSFFALHFLEPLDPNWTSHSIVSPVTVPLYFLVNTWATHGKVRYVPSIDDATVASAAYLMK